MSDRVFDSPEQFAEWILRTKRVDFWKKFKALLGGRSISNFFHVGAAKRILFSYIDGLRQSLRNGDSADLLARQTYESYKSAKAFKPASDVAELPLYVRTAFLELVWECADAKQIHPQMAIEAVIAVSDLIDRTIEVRVKSALQAKDEEIALFHASQEEIDAFPDEISATVDIDNLLKRAIDKYALMVNAGSCAIFKRDQSLGNYVNLSSNFNYESLFGDEPLKIDPEVDVEIIKHGKPIVIDGYKRSLPLITSYMRKTKAKSLLLLPLRVRKKCTGLVAISPPEDIIRFSGDEVSLAARFTNRLAVAMENTNLYLSQQRKFREAMALSEVLRLVSAPLEADVLCSRLAHIAADFSGGGLSAVYTLTKEHGLLSCIAHHGTINGLDPERVISKVVLPENMSEADYHSVFIRKEAAICDPEACPFISSEFSREGLVNSVFVVPLAARDYVIGALVIFYDGESKRVEPDEIRLITAIAKQAGVALKNAALYEDLEMSYFATVKALARAIEVQDPYTYGHSERVTEYATAIAKKMGVSEHDLRNIRFAAVLHDIGKIGIPERILNKREALNHDEKFSITTHPLIGDSIIEPVGFLRESGKIMIHHHERFDGGGYPFGIKGKDIPLGSRILAVADAFEAMLSDRPYRSAMEISEVIKELERNAGKQFDPDVVNALRTLIEEGDILQTELFPGDTSSSS